MDYFGLQKTTLIDFPGLVAATVFIPGCNLRCPYCHNPELVTHIEPDTLIPYDKIVSFLHKRQKVLEGICISGGEPLLYKGLPGFIDLIHSLGLKVKIDTNGTLPEILCSLSPDYIAMDIKTRPEKYHLLGNGKFLHKAERIKDSIKWIISSGISHEFRTTIAPGIVEQQDITEICSLIQGADRYILSQFRPQHTLDPGYGQFPPTSRKFLEELQVIVKKTGIPCVYRCSGTTNP